MAVTRESAQRLDTCWFVIERSAAVRDRPLARFVLNEPIVLVRNTDGQILALEDRCPHQGVPLSHGRLGPHGLMCRYHGWSFDSRGTCTFVPGASADSLGEIRVQNYRIREQDGLVWISRGAPAELPDCITAASFARPSIFLWEKKYLQPAAQMRPRAADFCAADGSVSQFVVRAPFGCSARITLCLTPETLVSSRVFASAQIVSRWLPQWAARILVMPHLARRADPEVLLSSNLPV
jgi:nitrite reductase/ring-hydroxylating ferredoxin subunit